MRNRRFLLHRSSCFYLIRNGIQNCEECIYGILNAADCFSNIREFVLGTKVGEIVSGKRITAKSVVNAFKRLRERKQEKFKAVKKKHKVWK